MDELLAGTLDLALAIAPVQLRGLVSVALAEEELVVVTTPDHPLVRRRSVTVPQLAEYPMVMFRPGYDLRTSTLASFAEHGVEPTVAVEGGEMGSVLALVAAGLGAAVVPGIVTTGETRLRVTRFRTPPPTRTIALVRGGDRVPSRAAEALATAFTEGITAAGWPGTDARGDAAPPVRPGAPAGTRGRDGSPHRSAISPRRLGPMTPPDPSEPTDAHATRPGPLGAGRPRRRTSPRWAGCGSRDGSRIPVAEEIRRNASARIAAGEPLVTGVLGLRGHRPAPAGERRPGRP